MSEPSKIKARPKHPRGLPRPKTAAASSFQWSQPPTTLSPATTTHTTSSLCKQTHLLTLLLRRNKNQHRSQPFFKHLHILRRALTRLLDIHTTLASTTSGGSSTSKSTSPTAESVRRRFEAEASLRAQRDVWEEHIREVVVPQCYVAFGAVVADTQFANLGLVLIGVLADVFALVGAPKARRDDNDDEKNQEGLEVGVDVEVKRRRGEVAVIEGTSTKATGQDWGEVVERVYEAADSDGGQEERVRVKKDTEVLDEDAVVDAVSGRHRQTDSFKSVVSKHIDVKTVVELQGKGDTSSKTAANSKQGHNDEEDDRPRKKKKKGKSTIDDLFKGLI